jgi:hyperosmotically inducible protein
MSFNNKFLICSIVLLSTIFIAGCQDRIHESWVEKPAAPVYDDPIIFARINGAVQDDPVLQGLDVNVEVNDGVVLLSGEVNDSAQADQVVMHSWRVDGVKDVNNQISLKQ